MLKDDNLYMDSIDFGLILIFRYYFSDRFCYQFYLSSIVVTKSAKNMFEQPCDLLEKIIYVIVILVYIFQ